MFHDMFHHQSPPQLDILLLRKLLDFSSPHRPGAERNKKKKGASAEFYKDLDPLNIQNQGWLAL